MRSLLLALAVATGCSAAPHEASAKRVTRDQLKFQYASEGARFDAAHACFAARSGWHARPLEVRGNFIDACWSTWEGTCLSPRNYQVPGARWANVETLHYPTEGVSTLDTFGVGVGVGERRAVGWSISVSASSNGEPVLGEHAFVNFDRDDDPKAGFSIGLRYVWTVADETFTHDVQEDPWAWLARVRSSPSALRSEAVSAWTALHDDVARALEAGEVRMCVREEYAGDGLPPACIQRVPLPPDLTVIETARIDAQLAAVHAAMSDVDLLHAQLIELAPLNCF